MVFIIEALEAKHGDCLLLQYGSADTPSYILVDGGPSQVFQKTLRQRLQDIMDDRQLEQLPIRLAMVSHIDDDHINGILDLLDTMATAQNENAPIPYRIDALWHNGFDDILGNETHELQSVLAASIEAALTSSTAADVPSLRHESALVLASVNQGRQLRDKAKLLGIPVNKPYQGLVALPLDGAPSIKLDGDDAIELQVLGPRLERAQALREEWDKQIKKSGVARSAAFTDDSVFNLASIIALVTVGGKRALLTGDARGDDIIAGLKQAGLLTNGSIMLDLLKLPHHGSDRNVSTSFFRQVKARKYLVSGDGKHGNPEIATLKMLLDARGGDSFTIYLTNLEPRLVDFFNQNARPNYKVEFRKSSDAGIAVHLI